MSPISRRSLVATAGIAAAAPALTLLQPSAATAADAPNAPAVPTASATPTTAPVPPGAKGPAIPASGYLVQEIAHRTFCVTDGLYQSVFLVTADGVVVVDAPPTIGHNLLRAISGVTKKPVTHAVYSHHHADHIGAMGLFDGARRYAHRDVAALLRQTPDRNRPVPHTTFADHLTLHVGDDTLRLDYHGPNHSPGNIFVHLPAQRVLMLVDVIFPGWVPFAYLAESQDIPGYLAAPDQALGYGFDTFVGGHLTRLGTRDDITVHQQYVSELRAEAGRAISTFDPGQIYGEVDAHNPWAVFNAYLNGVADQAALAVVPRWTDRLGGADVYTSSNAYAVVESLRIDYGQLGPFGIRP
ncbi:glyoxylase-like metal-dependent hydrolase (beta-lactamase superfamily II) [Catenulispora sp. MAP5-51]|uniref:MBL fold metallo-hydrolase n=1 Tax=Catenulispora sp. MAP5-51 TaxID=3156298 RepID=UPI003511543D